MRYLLAAAGPLKRGFYAEGCSLYAERLAKIAALDILEVRERGTDAARRRAETSAALLERTAGAFRIALDETGTMRSSEELASHLGQLELRGTSRVAVLVGGTDGHSDELRQTVDELWSLSPMTLPHEMARLMILEQLYRAETIRAGHPYHRA